MRTPIESCSGKKTDSDFGRCAAIKHLTLEGDYEVLLARFRSCK